jgi:hypothetical protein
MSLPSPEAPRLCRLWGRSFETGAPNTPHILQPRPSQAYPGPRVVAGGEVAGAVPGRGAWPIACCGRALYVLYVCCCFCRSRRRRSAGGEGSPGSGQRVTGPALAKAHA